MAEPPNRRSIVDEVFATGRYELVTKAGNGCFTEEVAFQLAQREPGQWFHLKKSGAQNQWNGHAVDAVLHESGYAVDIIEKSESTEARPSWNVDKREDGSPRYADRPELFRTPMAGCAGAAPEPEPEKPPAPPPDADFLLERVAALEAENRAQQDQIASLQGDRQLIDERLTALEQTEYVVTGSTGRTWGHGHPINLPVQARRR